MKKILKHVFSLALILSSFFFIESVSAATDSKICVYQASNYFAKNIHIIVRDDGSAYIADISKKPGGTLLNWDKADEGGFVGKDYYLNNNYECPPYAVISKAKSNVYMADEAAKQKISKKLKLEVTCNLVGQGLISSAPDNVKNSTRYTFTLPKKCSCETNPTEKNKILGITPKYSLSVSFEVNKTLTQPKVGLEYNHETHNLSLGNWYIGNDYSNPYSYVKDIVLTDSCPDYIVYSDGIKKWSSLSSASKLKEVYADAINGVVAQCHEVSEPTSNSNKTSNVTSNSNKVSNSSNSNIKPNANFMNIDQYKQCGGKSGVLITNIPSIVPRITSTLYNTIMVLVPVILIVMGSVDLIKGIMSQKEDEMKKGRETFVKRLIGAAIIFLIVLIVKIFVGAVSRDGKNSVRIVDCIDCFVSNSCDTMSK